MATAAFVGTDLEPKFVDINHDNEVVVSFANEGDYEDAFGIEGGSRGFTINHQDGTLF